MGPPYKNNDIRQMAKGRVQQKGRQCVRVAEIEVGGDGLDAQERELINSLPVALIIADESGGPQRSPLPI